MVEAVNKETLEWRGNAPVAPRFGDVYYSAENGLAETGFVFLEGTGAPATWREKEHFVIAETGFGTGLNFLATWKAWLEKDIPGRLTFVSVEGYPLSRSALEAAHQTFPDIAPYARKLYDAWPPPAPGFHPRSFEDGRINLILLFGDAASAFTQLQASVDAWYLDGFAPAKNPEMWSDDVLDQIARLSRPGTRFATFTAAGFVRRGLQARGFKVDKVRGYGTKRERLVGEMQASTVSLQASMPDWAQPSAPRPDGPIAVIGAGIAGASVAASLKRRGQDVTLIAGPGQAASRVPAAILAPRFLLDGQPSARFFTSAFAYATSLVAFQDAWAHVRGLGLLPKSADDLDKLNRVAEQYAWGADWLQANEHGLYLPMGGSLDTAAALSALSDTVPGLSGTVGALQRHDDGWLLKGVNGDLIMEARSVIVAAGLASSRLAGADDFIELRPNLGQVELARTSACAALPDHSIGFGGYATAAVGDQRTLGSTFDRLAHANEADLSPKETARQRILAGLTATTGVSIDQLQLTGSWTGLRATTADHLPFVGAVPDWAACRTCYGRLAQDARLSGLGAPVHQPGLYILTGLGSKGYQYGPLAAEQLAAEIVGDPLPLLADQMAIISPLRGLIRSLTRSKRA